MKPKFKLNELCVAMKLNVLVWPAPAGNWQSVMSPRNVLKIVSPEQYRNKVVNVNVYAWPTVSVICCDRLGTIAPGL